ncbi:hypothetical protein HT102_02425 [Hoyosella sp. G463]|uniref:Uncharacterized protein n=1 Tax=Lolliginicoccus lacisalsi TaxID=2742202 RepID=A0A927J9U5_9ACTN|nr:DUF6636 domain-containing protein [Lolliginicoccus lacisalsi]MBD8505343.1 hypothetical protein [Lolliginicoccus lacisalsi]
MAKNTIGRVAGGALACIMLVGCANGMGGDADSAGPTASAAPGTNAVDLPATSEPVQQEGSPTEQGTVAVASLDPFTDGEVVSFESPSGNILCWFGPRLAGSHGPEGRNSPAVACQIKSAEEPRPPRPEHCDENIAWYLSAVLLDGEAMKGTCSNGAIAPTGPSAALEYGQHLTAQGVRCASEASGVTCTDLGSGAGFRIAREGVDLF